MSNNGGERKENKDKTTFNAVADLDQKFRGNKKFFTVLSEGQRPWQRGPRAAALGNFLFSSYLLNKKISLVHNILYIGLFKTRNLKSRKHVIYLLFDVDFEFYNSNGDLCSTFTILKCFE